MTNTTIIVGAGLSGLLLARALVDRGASVMVLEKGREVGGRMATKRVRESVFDHGAQFFTVSDARFNGIVADWSQRGLVFPWPGCPHRWLGKPSMAAIPKALSADLEILRDHKVTSAMRAGEGWEMAIEGHGLLHAERLLLTLPLPLSLAILQAGDVVLPPNANDLGAIGYDPCLALLVALAGESTLPVDGILVDRGAIRWIADNSKKGISRTGLGAVTIHATTGFSRAHYGKPEVEITKLLLQEAQTWFGESPIVATSLQRFKFS